MSGTTALLGLAALVGMICQRSTGFGYALVAVPVFALVFGPFHGVLLSNTLSLPVNIVVLAGTWRRLRYASLTTLVPAGLFGAACGVVAARSLPSSYLLMLAGLAITSLVARLWISGRPATKDIVGPDHRHGLARTGATSGFLQAATGTGGPPMAIFASRAGWPLNTFVPTMQAFNIAIGLFTVALKGPLPMALSQLVTLLACLVVGSWVGSLLVKLVQPAHLRMFSMLLAAAGGAGAFVKGLLAL